MCAHHKEFLFSFGAKDYIAQSSIPFNYKLNPASHVKMLSEYCTFHIFCNAGLMWLCFPVNFMSSLTPRFLLEMPSFCVPDFFLPYKLLKAASQPARHITTGFLLLLKGNII